MNLFVFSSHLRESVWVLFLSLSLRESARVYFLSLSLRESAGVYFLSLSLRERVGVYFLSLSLRERVGVRGQAIDVNFLTSSQDEEDRVSLHPHPTLSHLLPSREKGCTLSSPLVGEDVRRTGEGYILHLIPTFSVQRRSIIISPIVLEVAA